MINVPLLKDLEQCGSAETLLAAILKHHPEPTTPVDVEALARSMGIVAFRDLPAAGATSAVMTDPATRTGEILCAPGVSVQRRRFAIAHQLGHFLLKTHGGDRQCSNRDLAESRRDSPHRKEEMQANRFAAGLLMPKPWFVALVDGLGKPAVGHLPTIAAAFGISLETAASRYADLTQTMSAFVFVKDGTMRYARPARSFPSLAIQPGDAAPAAVLAARPANRVAWMPTDARDWIAVPRGARPPKITMQIASKDNGFQLVMLLINAAAERRADEEAEKMATESPKFGRVSTRS